MTQQRCPRRRRATAVLLVLALGGCSGGGGLPAGVSISVYQTRSDVPAGKLEIRITNGSQAPITVTRAQLTSPLLSGAASWDRETLVPAQRIVDLKVALPPASCAPRAGPSAEVALEYRDAEGEPGGATVVPADPLEQLPDLTAGECLERAVARIATVTADFVVLGAAGPALLEVTAVPTGAPGAVVFERVLPTVLLTPVRRDGRSVPERSLTTSASAASGPVRIRVPLQPARCDLHALADDKRGTQIPFDVAVSSGESGRLDIALAEPLRAAVYRYLLRWCARHDLS